MQIIDSHVHFWNPPQLRYPWLDDLTAINRPFLPADYLAVTGEIQVSSVVFVQADGLPSEALDEVHWVQSLDPLIKAIIAFAPLEQGDAVRPHLEHLASSERVRGVRRLIQSEAVEFATQSGFVRGVQALADYQLSFDICVLHHQLGAVIDLVRQCPQVSFVLDHGGKPGIKAQSLDPWRDAIRSLASFENVFCKLSGLVTEADPENWSVHDLRPYVIHLIESFGTDRLMFGSDWSVVNLAGGYRRWFNALASLLAELSEEERQSIYKRNAAQFYGIDLNDL